MIAAQSLPGYVDLSLACPKISEFYPGERLARILNDLTRRRPALITDYSLPPGPPLLREQIAHHGEALGMHLDPKQIVITNGCLESLMLALRAATLPGDTVGIESPTYWGCKPKPAEFVQLAKRVDPNIDAQLGAICWADHAKDGS